MYTCAFWVFHWILAFFFFFLTWTQIFLLELNVLFSAPFVTSHNPAGASNLTYLNLNYSSAKSAAFPSFPLSVHNIQLWNLRIMFDSLPFLPATLKSLLRLVNSCHLLIPYFPFSPPQFKYLLFPVWIIT